jgi:hypothetical protein
MLTCRAVTNRGPCRLMGVVSAAKRWAGPGSDDWAARAKAQSASARLHGKKVAQRTLSISSGKKFKRCCLGKVVSVGNGRP